MLDDFMEQFSGISFSMIDIFVYIHYFHRFCLKLCEFLYTYETLENNQYCGSIKKNGFDRYNK